MYTCPDNAKKRHEMSLDILQRIEDLNVVLNQTKEHKMRLLAGVAKEMEIWCIKVCECINALIYLCIKYKKVSLNNYVFWKKVVLDNGITH